MRVNWNLSFSLITVLFVYSTTTKAAEADSIDPQIPHEFLEYSLNLNKNYTVKRSSGNGEYSYYEVQSIDNGQKLATLRVHDASKLIDAYTLHSEQRKAKQASDHGDSTREITYHFLYERQLQLIPLNRHGSIQPYSDRVYLEVEEDTASPQKEFYQYQDDEGTDSIEEHHESLIKALEKAYDYHENSLKGLESSYLAREVQDLTQWKPKRLLRNEGPGLLTDWKPILRTLGEPKDNCHMGQ